MRSPTRYRLRYSIRAMLIGLALATYAFWPIIKKIRASMKPRPVSIRWIAYKELAKFDIAVKEYFIDIGELPASLDELVTRPAHLPDTAHWDGPYLAEGVNRLDPWRQPISYEITDHVKRKYVIWSNGPDRMPWTGDDLSYEE